MYDKLLERLEGIKFEKNIRNLKELKEIFKRANELRYVCVYDLEENKFYVESHTNYGIKCNNFKGKKSIYLKHHKGRSVFRYFVDYDYLNFDCISTVEDDMFILFVINRMLYIFTPIPVIEDIEVKLEGNTYTITPIVYDGVNKDIYSRDNCVKFIWVDKVSPILDKFNYINEKDNKVILSSENQVKNFLEAVKRHEFVTIIKDLPSKNITWQNTKYVDFDYVFKRDKKERCIEIVIKNDVNTSHARNYNECTFYFDKDISEYNLTHYKGTDSFLSDEDKGSFDILVFGDTIIIFHDFMLERLDFRKVKGRYELFFKYANVLVNNGQITLDLTDF